MHEGITQTSAVSTERSESPSPLRGEGNLALLLSAASARWPARCALVHGGVEITYAELEQRSQRVAASLRALAVGVGDRVGLQVANSPAFAAAYFAILSLGAIVVPQNPLATARETDESLLDAGAKLVLVADVPKEGGSNQAPGFRRIAIHSLGGNSMPRQDIHPVADNDTAVILYTSGTTGRPKGAELTHANLGRNANAAQQIYALTTEDVVLGVLPLYHSYGQTCTLNGAMAVGARVVLVDRFDPDEVVELIHEHAVTFLPGVPTMFSDLAHCAASPAAFASLRLSASGGAPLPSDVLRAFEARSGTPLYETYGLSETSPIASCNGLREPRRPGTAGWPISGTEIKIVSERGGDLLPGETGEIAIRGHNVMKGYWGNSQATAAAIDIDGWFHSGDLGMRDDDGCIRIVGRLKEIIIRGGFNVYPREVEDVLHQHPDVRAAAVIGIDDARLGEEIGAAVVFEPDSRTSLPELREWVKARVTPYKYPRYLWLVDQLPTGPTGKVLKRAITAPSDVRELWKRES